METATENVGSNVKVVRVRSNEHNVSAEQFAAVLALVFNECRAKNQRFSAELVAKKLNLKEGTVITRANTLRTKKKMNLPKFDRKPGGGQKIDVDAINKMLANTLKTEETEKTEDSQS